MSVMMHEWLVDKHLFLMNSIFSFFFSFHIYFCKLVNCGIIIIYSYIKCNKRLAKVTIGKKISPRSKSQG